MPERLGKHGAQHAHPTAGPALNVHGVDRRDLARRHADQIREFGVAIKPPVAVNRRDEFSDAPSGVVFLRNGEIAIREVAKQIDARDVPHQKPVASAIADFPRGQ